MSIAYTLHVLASVIWVGGMFFAYVALRPVAAQLLDPPLRLTLWRDTFRRFFPWVWAAIILLPVTGYWMLFSYFGGMATTAGYIHTMQLLGIIMILIYLHVFFGPFKRLSRAVDAEDFQAAGKSLNQIRILIGINLTLGLLLIALVILGKYL